jgi:hypothetical protein
MANEGTRGVMKGMTLKRAIAIKNNRYKGIQTVARGSGESEVDYSKEEIDDFINSAAQNKADRIEDEIDKQQRREALFQNQQTYKMMSDHVKEIESMEDKKALKLIRQYREIRNSLRDRLDQVDSRTFTAQQMRGVLMQIDSALLEMQHRLGEGMKDAVNDVSIKGIEHLFQEYEYFNETFTGAVSQIDVDKIEIVQETSNLLFNRYDASIAAYTQDLRAKLALGLTQAVIEETSYPRVIKNLSSFFLGEEWRLQRIVRTELSNVYNISKQNTMTELVDSGQIPKLKKTLFNPMDARTANDSKFVEQLHLIVDIDEPFVYTYKGKKYQGMTPPFRPNDRAVLIPYSEDWG